MVLPVGRRGTELSESFEGLIYALAVKGCGQAARVEAGAAEGVGIDGGRKCRC